MLIQLTDSILVKIGIVVSYIPDKITIEANQKLTVRFIESIRTNIPGDKSKRGEAPWKAALREFNMANEMENLMTSHIEEWERNIWNQGSIEVEGNPNLAQIVESSLYWIVMSTRADWPWSLSPGSLASNAYNGHSFWDCETWMFPPLLILYPEIAKSLLEYRFNHLEAAKAKAKGYNQCGADGVLLYDCLIWPPDPGMWASMSPYNQARIQNIIQQVRYQVINEDNIQHVKFANAFTTTPESEDYQGNCNYRGALFAWEAGFTGAEVCPCMGGGTCLHEHHVSGDIAFAVYQYWQTTHDKKWLKDVGFPLAYEIAVFWETRVVQNGSQYEILQVIPPDEAANGVNNSVFTNIIAQYSLRIASEFGEILSIETPAVWYEIADNIKIPFDTERQIHLEYDGYSNNTIKQADVVLLGYPLQYPMSHKIRENDLNFYSSVTSPRGPAMTWSVTAIGYLEVYATRAMEASCHVRDFPQQEADSLLRTASEYFFHSYQNAQPPYHIWTETSYGVSINHSVLKICY